MAFPLHATLHETPRYRALVVDQRRSQIVTESSDSQASDIGRSSGVYACAMAARMPVTGAVFERPPVDAAARTLLAQRGQAGRITVISGDMFTGPLPVGFDLHLFSHVLHDWDEDSVRSLLTASYAALPPGGFLVDHDVHISATKTCPLAAAEYSVFLMHSTPANAGRPAR